jgi:hypothetical protein
MLRACVLSGFVLIGLGFASVAQASRFDILRLSVDGEVLAVAPADLDGDGKGDLVVAYRHGYEPDSQRFFAIFWNRGHGFAGKPDLVLPADDRSCAFDVADIDDRAGAELITVGREGVSATRFAQRKAEGPELITSDATLFYKPDATALPRLRLVHDLGKHGRQLPVLVVPLLGAVAVYTPKGERWVAAARIDVAGKNGVSVPDRVSRSEAALTSFGVSYQSPGVHLTDADGDGLADLIVTLEDRVAVFRQHAGLTFDAKPSYRRNFAVRSASEQSRLVQDAHITVGDFDGDGIADLVIAKVVGKGITSAATTHLLYLGRRGGGWPAEPDQTLKIDGLGGSDTVEPIDLTGDGHPDLIVPTVTLGVWNIIRMLTTKTLSVTFQVFPFLPERHFSDKPVAQRELKFKISLAGDSDLPALEIHGDFNGDRHPDLAFGMSDSEIGIFAGVAGGGLVTKDPVERIKVDSRGRLVAVDLDRKGKDDIVLFYPSTLGHRHEIVVLANRGPW